MHASIHATGKVVQPKFDFDMEHEYFCVVDEVRHDGKKCPICGRMSSVLAEDMRVKEVVVPVKYKVYFKKGCRDAVLAKIAPNQQQYGWNDQLGDYRIISEGVADGGIQTA